MPSAGTRPAAAAAPLEGREAGTAGSAGGLLRRAFLIAFSALASLVARALISALETLGAAAARRPTASVAAAIPSADESPGSAIRP